MTLMQITFTGIDSKTSIDGIRSLSAAYPIEWGILCSRKLQGDDNRYPDEGTIQKFLENDEVAFAAHLCGAYAKEIMVGDLYKLPEFIETVERVQINHIDPLTERIAKFSDFNEVRCIAQCRDGFPETDVCDWLYDPSGGQGKAQTSWPAYPGRYVGYAGGIGPDNVGEVLKSIAADGPFWIDMESGIRTDNWLDLDKCRKVCEIAFGY
jgi:hypothetical protein